MDATGDEMDPLLLTMSHFFDVAMEIGKDAPVSRLAFANENQHYQLVFTAL
jgi:hypothetical protein